MDEKPQRNAKGQFIKGHTAIITPAKPGEMRGAPKQLKTQIKDALSIAEDEMPNILEAMVKRAKDDEHRDSQRAGEYLMDRLYGKARQGLDVGIQSIQEITITVIRESLEG